jgi:ABC-type nitrate/sulfonate/bicarbonate transport system ATPase subunit
VARALVNHPAVILADEDLFEKCEFDLLTRKALGMELLNLLKFSNK